MANEVRIVIGADSQNAQAELKKVESAFGRMRAGISKHSRAIGMGMTAIGGALSAVSVLAVRSSQEQQIGINRLDQSLKNVGSSYANQKAQIEAVIEAQQRKTNFGDEAQRDALQKLITIGGQYEGSLEALKVTTDLAAGANMDLNSAALLVGKAIAGETGSLSRYGIVLEKGASQTEIMAALTAQFGGQAEAAADPMVQLKNRMGDMVQVLGDALLPMVNKAAVALEKITRNVIGWTEEHPQLTKVLGIAAAAIGGIMLVVGPLILALPFLISGFGALGVAVTIATGPIGIIALGLAGLGAAAVLLWKNWRDVWNFMLQAVQNSVNAIIGVFNALLSGHSSVIATMIDSIEKLVSAMTFGRNPLADQMTAAANAIRQGIPEIDLGTLKVEEFTQAIDDSSLEMEKSAETATAVLPVIAENATNMASEVGTAFESVKADVIDLDAVYDRWLENEIQRGIQMGRDVTEPYLQQQRAKAAADAEYQLELEDLRAAQKRADEGWVAHKLEVANREIDVEFNQFKETQRLAAEATQLAAAAAAEQIRIDEEVANATKQRQDRIISGWDAVRNALDPVLSKLRDFGVRASDVITKWAEETGQSSTAIIDHLASIEVAHTDLKSIVGEFASATNQSLDTVVSGFEKVAEVVEETVVEVVEDTKKMAADVGTVMVALASKLAPPTTAAPGGFLTPQAMANPQHVRPGFQASPMDYLQMTMERNIEGIRQIQAGATIAGPQGGVKLHREFIPGATESFQKLTTEQQFAQNFIGRAAEWLRQGGGMTVVTNIMGDVIGVDDLESRILQTVRDGKLAGGLT